MQRLHPGSLRERIQVRVAQWYLVIRLVLLPIQQVLAQVPPQHQFVQGQPWACLVERPKSTLGVPTDLGVDLPGRLLNPVQTDTGVAFLGQ